MDFGWLCCVSLDPSVVAKEGILVMGWLWSVRAGGIWETSAITSSQKKRKSQWNTDKILMKIIYPNGEMLQQKK